MVDSKHLIGMPHENRFGAAVRYPALASQSAWFLRSGLIPAASWITTTPGQGSST
jgi:hypothetical protein